jgi:hypothetical protein
MAAKTEMGEWMMNGDRGSRRQLSVTRCMGTGVGGRRSASMDAPGIPRRRCCEHINDREWTNHCMTMHEYRLSQFDTKKERIIQVWTGAPSAIVRHRLQSFAIVWNRSPSFAIVRHRSLLIFGFENPSNQDHHQQRQQKISLEPRGFSSAEGRRLVTTDAVFEPETIMVIGSGDALRPTNDAVGGAEDTQIF